MKKLVRMIAICVALDLSTVVNAQSPPETAQDSVYFPPPATAQTEADEYTSYELLAPGTASFRISYEVTATTRGAQYFYNPIRKGSTRAMRASMTRCSGRHCTLRS